MNTHIHVCVCVCACVCIRTTQLNNNKLTIYQKLNTELETKYSAPSNVNVQ